MYELHCWPVFRHHTVSYLGQSQSSFLINKAPELRGSSSALIMNHIDTAGDVGDSRTLALLAMTKFEAHDEKPFKYMPEPPLCINLNDSQLSCPFIHPSIFSHLSAARMQWQQGLAGLLLTDGVSPAVTLSECLPVLGDVSSTRPLLFPNPQACTQVQMPKRFDHMIRTIHTKGQRLYSELAVLFLRPPAMLTSFQPLVSPTLYFRSLPSARDHR